LTRNSFISENDIAFKCGDISLIEIKSGGKREREREGERERERSRVPKSSVIALV